MILITNDDGFQSEGLSALRSAVSSVHPHETVTIVAPRAEQSQIGHRVTTDTPLEVKRHAENVYSVAGTPADCVRVALFGLSLQPRLVLSGINHGGNLGHDIPISGTVAAVREAAYHGISGIAFSQYLKQDIPVHWSTATRRVEDVLLKLAADLASEDLPSCYNVNLPCLDRHAAEPEQKSTFPSKHPLPVSFEEVEQRPGKDRRVFLYKGIYSLRNAESGSDVACCFAGDISISHLDFPAGGTAR